MELNINEKGLFDLDINNLTEQQLCFIWQVQKGYKWRYDSDWSSDVCSSDLDIGNTQTVGYY